MSKRDGGAVIVRAAIGWWKSKRPLSYTHREHLGNPEINTVGSKEKSLAIAVSKYLIA